MSRKDELLELIGEDSTEVVKEIVEEIIFIERKLVELKKLPFIEVHPKNPTKQRNTPAAKMYKELLQQYLNCIKVIENVIYKEKRLDGENIEISPVREWFENYSGLVNGMRKETMKNADTGKNNMDTG